MAKQQVSQKYIFKLHTDRLKKARWNLKLTLAEARRNDEIISIGDSQVLRWIDEINGVEGAEEKVRDIRSQIKRMRREENTAYNRKQIKALYGELDAVQFKPDYMHLVVDSNKDFLKACRGFEINGVKYVRLVGTSGGVKMSTVVFVSEHVASTLRERIDNGRNHEVPLVPAKLEAYRALACSGSIPVSMPRGILVVPDCVTHFQEDVLYLTDENEGEPEMRLWKNYDVELTESDGYGLMCPALAERWSEELRLGYTMSAANTRFSYEKGCVFTFDFHEFAERVAGMRMVKDVWGNEVDIGKVELVLTASMLKLWNCYESLEHYLKCCEENHYTFGIAKTAPRELENRRALNYQFVQSYNLTDAQIDELIRPTVDDIRDVLTGDYRKAILFMAGMDLDDEKVLRHTDVVKAMMICPDIYNDPFVKQKIKRAIKKKIDDAKIGVLDVRGNYSILCGDPYALCQSIFGLEVTGLLEAGELYNKYWVDAGATEVAVFRAPMSTHENIKKMQVADGEEAAHWYQYIKTCTMLNAWDGTVNALNGADKDGDIIFITDNEVLVDNIRPTLTLVCAQKSAQKKVVTEADLIQSNIDGFGNEVGKVTNRVTSMYDVQAQFEPGSAEYETLAYRIRCGQQFQQNTIDKTKGIVSKPMPKYWYDGRAIERPADDSPEALARYELNRRIVADRKPYFMRYIYPVLKREYNTYLDKVNMKALCEFARTIDELEAISAEELTQEQREFLENYRRYMPVGIHDCTMNRICRRVEELCGSVAMKDGGQFDSDALRSGVSYNRNTAYAIKKLYDIYKVKARALSVANSNKVANVGDSKSNRVSLSEEFRREAITKCNDARELCDIVLDLSYSRLSAKQFAWDVVGDVMLDNLLKRSGGVIEYPIADPDGDIEYRGEKYSMTRLVIQDEGNYSE